MDYYKDIHRYDDIIDMPHHQSTKRAHMSIHDRAAQFNPFAAMVGHKEAINETAKISASRPDYETEIIEPS